MAEFPTYEQMAKNVAEKALDEFLYDGKSIREWMKIIAEQEQKTGRWIDADGDNAICGCCNRLNHLYGEYCKHCGAKMVEPQESEE